MLFKVEHTRTELLLMYRLVRKFGAFFDGYEVGTLPQPPPVPAPLLAPRPVSPLTLF
jgi:hypothetical protein